MEGPNYELGDEVVAGMDSDIRDLMVHDLIDDPRAAGARFGSFEGLVPRRSRATRDRDRARIRSHLDLPRIGVAEHFAGPRLAMSREAGEAKRKRWREYGFQAYERRLPQYLDDTPYSEASRRLRRLGRPDVADGVDAEARRVDSWRAEAPMGGLLGLLGAIAGDGAGDDGMDALP